MKGIIDILSRHVAKLIIIGIATITLGVGGCFDSSTEKAPPSINTSTPGGGGSKPLPTAVNDTLSVPLDTDGIVSVLDNDTPVGTGTLSIASFDASSTEGGVITAVGGGQFRYTPPAGFEGEDTFTYTLKDSNGSTVKATVNVTISHLVIPNGQAYYAANCAICHSAGTADTTIAFNSSDLVQSNNPLTRDLTMYGGPFQLMGAFYPDVVSQRNIDELKAYLASLTP